MIADGDVEFLETGDGATGDGSMRMLGAIRAAEPCLACHQAERGQLLGAFSYDARRVEQTRAPVSSINASE